MCVVALESVCVAVAMTMRKGERDRGSDSTQSGLVCVSLCQVLREILYVSVCVFVSLLMSLVSLGQCYVRVSTSVYCVCECHG